MHKDVVKNILLLDELKEFVVPLSKEEFEQLKENIILEGCRDPLIVWEKENGELILVDGHNRLKICQQNNIDYQVRKLNFKNIDGVKVWMINNQLGRRNLNPNQLSYYRGLKYESLKKSRGGAEYFDSKYQSDTLESKEISTSESLASEFKVGRATIMRDAKFARALNVIGKSNPTLKNKILSGETKVKRSDLFIFSDMGEKNKFDFKNEADLYNKAQRLRNKVLSDIEKKLKESKEESIKRAREELQSTDPLFASTEERINRIKGQILSAMNRAIQNKDIEAIKELKGLIEKLQNLLFGD